MPALFPLPTLLRAAVPPGETAGRSASLSLSFLEILCAQMWFVSGCKHLSFTLPWRCLLAYLVALHLLRPGSAEVRVVALSLPVTATVGQDVVLRCHLSPCKDARSLDIRWIRHTLSGFVHHYQNGEDLAQMEEYKGRTELLRDGLSDGNLDLHITAVSSSDSGSYTCTVQDDGGYAEAVVNLKVSDPFSQIVHPWKVALTVVLTFLVGSFVIIVFLHRKQAAQARKLKRRDAVLAELPAILDLSAENLEKQVAELAERIETLDKGNSLLKKRYDNMDLSAANLKKQVAELEKHYENMDLSAGNLKKQAAKLVKRTEEFEKGNLQLKKRYDKMDLSAGNLKKQVAELVVEIEEVEKYCEKMERKDEKLEKQAAKLVERIETLEKGNSQLREQYIEMDLSAANLKKQVAELVEQIEELELETKESAEQVSLREALSAAIPEIKIENQPHFPKFLPNMKM